MYETKFEPGRNSYKAENSKQYIRTKISIDDNKARMLELLVNDRGASTLTHLETSMVHTSLENTTSI